MAFEHLIGGALQAPEDPAAPRIVRYRPVGALPASAYCTLSNQQYQAAASSCLPHAVEFVLASDVKARTGAHIAACRLDIYYGARVLANDWPNDVGSYPHLAQQWLAEHGTLPEILAPYDWSIVKTWKPKTEWAADRAAWTARLERMPASVSQIKAEIAANKGVIVCHQVFQQMTEGTGVEIGVSGPSLGGHARAVMGYDDARGAFLVINSWRGWGIAHPIDPMWQDSISWVPYPVMIDPDWSFDFRRIAKGLEVET